MLRFFSHSRPRPVPCNCTDLSWLFINNGFSSIWNVIWWVLWNLDIKKRTWIHPFMGSKCKYGKQCTRASNLSLTEIECTYYIIGKYGKYLRLFFFFFINVSSEPSSQEYDFFYKCHPDGLRWDYFAWKRVFCLFLQIFSKSVCAMS